MIPDESPYLSQFSPLPLDWMYENVQAQQKGYDQAFADKKGFDYGLKHIQGTGVNPGASQLTPAQQAIKDMQAKVEAETNALVSDPFSWNKVSHNIQGLKNEWTNNPLRKQLETNLAQWEEDQKMYRTQGQKTLPAYLKYHNTNTFKGVDEEGNPTLYTPDQGLPELRDWGKAMKDAMGKFNSDGQGGGSWTYGEDASGDMVTQKWDKDSEYIMQQKVRDVANVKADSFITTPDGIQLAHSYLDEMGFNPSMGDLRNVTPQDMMKIPMGTDAQGNVISAYDVIRDRVASDLEAAALEQVFMKESYKTSGSVQMSSEDRLKRKKEEQMNNILLTPQMTSAGQEGLAGGTTINEKGNAELPSDDDDNWFLKVSNFIGDVQTGGGVTAAKNSIKNMENTLMKMPAAKRSEIMNSTSYKLLGIGKDVVASSEGKRIKVTPSSHETYMGILSNPSVKQQVAEMGIDPSSVKFRRDGENFVLDMDSDDASVVSKIVFDNFDAMYNVGKTDSQQMYSVEDRINNNKLFFNSNAKMNDKGEIIPQSDKDLNTSQDLRFVEYGKGYDKGRLSLKDLWDKGYRNFSASMYIANNDANVGLVTQVIATHEDGSTKTFSMVNPDMRQTNSPLQNDYTMNQTMQFLKSGKSEYYAPMTTLGWAQMFDKGISHGTNEQKLAYARQNNEPMIKYSRSTSGGQTTYTATKMEMRGGKMVPINGGRPITGTYNGQTYEIPTQISASSPEELINAIQQK